VLAHRLGPRKRPDVEFVFAVTGCEEASLGGGDALAREMDGIWDRKETVFIGLDTITNGDLQFLEFEGEICQMRVPDWLARLTLETAASEPRFRE